jgi:hypothetical protein
MTTDPEEFISGLNLILSSILSSEFILKSIPLYSLALSFEGIKAAANVSIRDSKPDLNFGNRHKYFVQYSGCFSQDYLKICRQN